MGKAQRLTEMDLQSIHRLVSDLREMRHDRPAMHVALIDTLTRLVGGTCGFSCEVADWRTGGNLQIHSLTSDSASGGAISQLIQGLCVNNNLWDDPSFVEGVRRTGVVEATPFHELISHAEFQRKYPVFDAVKRDMRHVDHLIAWHRTGPARQDILGVSVQRWGKTERRFGRRETELARLIFEELNWLYTTGRLAPPVPGLTDLPPRLAEVLGMLRVGQSPKQIAAKLGLSVHTVREHIKRLYDRLGVSDRNELTALLDKSRADWRPPVTANAFPA